MDFILEYKKSCLAVEVKASARWSEGGLDFAEGLHGQPPSSRAGMLAYNGSQTAQLGKKLWAVPLGTMLS